MAKFGKNICIALLVVGVISVTIGTASGSLEHRLLRSGGSLYPGRGRGGVRRGGTPCISAEFDCSPGDICVAKASGIDRICMPRPR